MGKVLKKGCGIDVINEYLCTFNDAASISSYNTNFSVSTYQSLGGQSTRSLRSIGGKSTRSMKSTRSAMSVRGHQQITDQSSRNASGNIDKILQHMLTATNENDDNGRDYGLTQNNLNNLNNINEEDDDQKMENPKYREYLNLYLVVRNRVCNAKVLSFNGETKIYSPFKWMNEQLKEQKKEQLKEQQNKKEQEEDKKDKDTDNKDDDIKE